MPRPASRTILFQRKRANRRILNEHMFLDVLREFGEVRPLLFSQTFMLKISSEASAKFIDSHLEVSLSWKA